MTGNRIAVCWFLLAVIGFAAAAEQCADALAWSPGVLVPSDHASLQRSIGNLGNLRRLAPVLAKLSTANATARVLVVGGDVEKGGCWGCGGHLWQDVLGSWLRSSFPAKLEVSEFLLLGPLSSHLQSLPEVAAELRPDLVLAQVSLSPLLDQGWKGTENDRTPKHLVQERFMRALLLLPGSPAIVWVDALPSKLHSNYQATDASLVQYYDVPQVSVLSAWRGRLPFEERDLWETPARPSLLGHKVIAATVTNFLCFELRLACAGTSPGNGTGLPKPLYLVAAARGEEPRPRPGAAEGPSAEALARLGFCRAAGAAPALLPGEAGGGAGGEDQTWIWTLLALSVVPAALFHVAAAFVGTRGQGTYLQCNLPQCMPELQLLRVAATLALVASRLHGAPPPAAGLACEWCRGGKYCLHFFLLLMGFLLALSAARNGMVNAVWHFAQVWPLHALGLLLAVVSGASVQPLDLALTASLLHAWVAPFHSGLNGPSWYVSVLLALWVVTPTWVRAADRIAALRGIRGLLLALLAAWLSSLLLPFLLEVWPAQLGLREGGPHAIIRNFVEYSPYANWQPFLVGVLLGCLTLAGVEARSRAAVCASFALGLLGLAAVWLALPPSRPGASAHLLLDKGFALQPFFVLLIFAAVGARRFPYPLQKWLTGAPMLFLAKLCWPIFILHDPVYRLHARLLDPSVAREGPVGALAYALLYLLLLLAASFGAWRFVDQPWARLLYRTRKGAGGAELPSYQEAATD